MYIGTLKMKFVGINLRKYVQGLYEDYKAAKL